MTTCTFWLCAFTVKLNFALQVPVLPTGRVPQLHPFSFGEGIALHPLPPKEIRWGGFDARHVSSCSKCSRYTFPPPQVHVLCAVWLSPTLHPGCGAAAVGPGPRTLQTDHHGRGPQHLAPLQDPAGVRAPPPAAALQEHHHHLPQEDQRVLHHRAELQLPPSVQAVPVQRGARGHWPQKATSVRGATHDLCRVALLRLAATDLVCCFVRVV